MSEGGYVAGGTLTGRRMHAISERSWPLSICGIRIYHSDGWFSFFRVTGESQCGRCTRIIAAREARRG